MPVRQWPRIRQTWLLDIVVTASRQGAPGDQSHDLGRGATEDRRRAAPPARALRNAEGRAGLDRVRRCDAPGGVQLSFEFLVLTAARSDDVRHARWHEIDRDGALLTVPAERLKDGALAVAAARHDPVGAAALLRPAGLARRCAPGRRATIALMAPGGFGKTTVLAAACRDAVANGVPFSRPSRTPIRQPVPLARTIDPTP